MLCLIEACCSVNDPNRDALYLWCLKAIEMSWRGNRQIPTVRPIDIIQHFLNQMLCQLMDSRCKTVDLFLYPELCYVDFCHPCSLILSFWWNYPKFLYYAPAQVSQLWRKSWWNPEFFYFTPPSPPPHPLPQHKPNKFCYRCITVLECTGFILTLVSWVKLLFLWIWLCL